MRATSRVWGLFLLAWAGMIFSFLSAGGFAEEAEVNAVVNLSKQKLPEQVLIEVLVADISHDDDFELGFQHEFRSREGQPVSLYNDAYRTGSGSEYTERNQAGDLGDVIARFPLTERSGELFQGMDITGQVLDVDAGQLLATIQALAVTGKGEILARPCIVAIDGQEAVIDTGQKVPFLTRQVTARSEIFVSAFKDTGTKLTVTPHVRWSEEGDPFVELVVAPEVSFVSRRREEKGVLLPVVATRNASTTVLVASGKTFIMGGLFRDNETVIKRGVPGLSKIPIFGGLFTSRSKSILKSELVISITPTVLSAVVEPKRRDKGEPVLGPEEKQIPKKMEMQLLEGWGEVIKEPNSLPTDTIPEASSEIELETE